MRNNFYKSLPTTFEKEVQRVKVNRINELRRFFGVLNVRIKFDKEADMFFTYGCMLLTNKPYFIYIENGVAIYNYDMRIANNPVARILFSFLVKRKNCKKLIFMSEAGQKSFFATVPYSKKTKSIALEKSIQIYPLIEKKDACIKKFQNSIKLLFSGVFYMKGGVELINAFEKIRKKHKNIFLTVVTPLHTMKENDISKVKSIEGITLLDATFDEAGMNQLYKAHDIFMLPTFRDGFGLVLVEAISWAMPIICTDQYATTEVAINDFNALVYPNHPLKDYDTETYRLLGKYNHPRDFYISLFKLQQEGKTKPVEEFIYNSMEKFILNPELVEEFSKNSLELYNNKFHQDLISNKIESAFLQSL
jgi:glycosyltransferase involved in cell wall biosynthesis